MSEKKHQSMRLRVRDIDTLTHLYGTKTAGMQEAIDGLLPLRMHTIRELGGRFTKSELTAMTDYLRHMPIEDPINRINKETLISHILDSSERDDLEVKYGINYNELIIKIEALTAAQVFFLQSEIYRYWKNNKGMRKNIDAFIETLI